MCECVLLQQRPQRASFRGQSAWGGRMVLTGYVTHVLVVMHHRHCLKKEFKKIWQWPVNYVRKQKNGISKAKRKRVGATDRSVSPQTSPTGEGEGGGGASGYTSSTWDISLSFKHTHARTNTKGNKWTKTRPCCSLPSHYWDIPHSSFRSFPRKLRG